MPTLTLPPPVVYDLNLNRTPPRMIPIVLAAVPDPWFEFCSDNKIQPIQITAYENEVENQKIWAACGVLARGIERGDHANQKKIVDSSSGNFVLALAWACDEIKRRWPGFPVEGVVAVVPRSTPKEKRLLLEAAGIELAYADNSLAAMELAAELAEKHGYWYTRQYWNSDNAEAWEDFGRNIADQLPNLGALAIGVGSGGSCTGIMRTLTSYFVGHRETPMSFWRTAVVVEEDEVEGIPQAVDGVRNPKSLRPGTLPWWENVDSIRYVTEERSRINSAGLWRQNTLVPGSNCIGAFSTGFTFEGLMLALRERAMLRLLDELRNPDGIVEAGFLAADTRKPYRSKYARYGIHFE